MNGDDTERVRHIKTDSERGRRTLAVLASEPRLRLLEYLSDRVANVSEIASELGMSVSTATLHVSALEEAGLVTTELRPASRGIQKVCARLYDCILVEFSHGADSTDETVVEVSMPVGAYTDCEATATCGLASAKGLIGLVDDPLSFYEPERVHAQLLWFRHGFVEYRFPNRLPPYVTPTSLTLSAEVCSEAPLHRDDWPSDISVSINKTEIGTWTAAGDFGGQRGALTPDWWETRNTQYGHLKVWRVTNDGTFIDGMRLSDVCLEDLDLSGPVITLRIGVAPDARHVGGLNLFGERFGNYPQDMVLTLRGS
jgi:predicted transcriptional regulator